jgi:hypothetical protein
VPGGKSAGTSFGLAAPRIVLKPSRFSSRRNAQVYGIFELFPKIASSQLALHRTFNFKVGFVSVFRSMVVSFFSSPGNITRMLCIKPLAAGAYLSEG